MKKMFEVLVSDDSSHDYDMLVHVLEKETRFCGGVAAICNSNNRISIAIAVNEKFRDYCIQRVREEIADYISVEYKYEYFMKNLNLSALSTNEKVAFCSALAVFDKATDKKYVLQNLLFGNEIVIDSAVAFCMPRLFDRWSEIVELVESNKFELSSENGLIEMMRFLLKSSPNESEKIHLDSKDDNLYILNDSGCVQFKYLDKKESDTRLLHRIISLLPRQIAVHGERFNYLYTMFPNAKKQEVETIL